MRAWRAAWLGVLALLPGLAGTAGAQSLADPRLVVETLTTGLALPTSMAFLGPGDILVLEKSSGNVRRVLDGTLQPDPVLTVSVNSASERGLLGIAVNSESPPAVFLYYTEPLQPSGLANRVYRYTWNPVDALLESPVLILDLPGTPGPNHDGGVLVLGPPGEQPGVGDGALLHAVIGDLNRNGQLENFESGAAPDDTAVIFRVRQDGSAAAGNPFPSTCSVTSSQGCSLNSDCPGGEVCLGRYLAYGVRNSFGLAIDPVTGDLWDTENGPALFDEVNRVVPGTNSGWEDVMGPAGPGDLDDLFVLPGSSYSDPEFSWEDTVAPTAILFPVGSSLGRPYHDHALIGDNNNGRIYALPLDAGRQAFDLAGFSGLGDLVANPTMGGDESDALVLGEGFGAITDLELGPDGHVYGVSISQGAIFRIRGPGVEVPALGVPGLVLLAGLLAAAGVLARRASRPRSARAARP